MSGTSHFRSARRDLGVQSVLTGTFQYVDGRIRVNMQLVDPTSNRNLWAQDYEERFEDVFAVQADIATRVAAALGAELTVGGAAAHGDAPDDVRRGLRDSTCLALNHQNSGRRIDALSQFERAIEIDPAFSLAYGKLALLYARALIDEVSGPAASIAPSELERRVSENARAALNLDPDSPAAYTALGVLHTLFWRWSEAEAAHAASLALNSNDLEALHFYAIFQSSRGQYHEAIPMAKRILELNPPAPNTEGDSPLYNLWLAHVYSGNVDAALEVLNEHLALDPAHTPARINLGFVQARRGDTQEAARAFRRVEESTEGRRPPLCSRVLRMATPESATRERPCRCSNSFRPLRTSDPSAPAHGHSPIWPSARSSRHWNRSIVCSKKSRIMSPTPDGSIC